MTGSPDFFTQGMLYTDRQDSGGPAVEFYVRWVDRLLGPDKPVAHGYSRIETSDGMHGPWQPGHLDIYDWPRFRVKPDGEA